MAGVLVLSRDKTLVVYHGASSKEISKPLQFEVDGTGLFIPYALRGGWSLF